jgi:hypothetical protein
VPPRSAEPARRSLAQKPRRLHRPCSPAVWPAAAPRAATRTIAAASPHVVAPPRNLVAALIALGENLSLLLYGPSPAAASARKYLEPARRFRLRFVQKLSVRHVPNPLDSAGQRLADQRCAVKVGSKGRSDVRSQGRERARSLASEERREEGGRAWVEAEPIGRR